MVVEAIDRAGALEQLLGKGDRCVDVLKNADQRCQETSVDPCGICRVQDMISLTRNIETAKNIAEICCPAGKMAANLERKLAAMPK